MASSNRGTPASSAAARSQSTAATPQYGTAGGFIRTTLPSPAPSTASSRAAARLPHPRSKPLLPGSRKEDYARDYISQRMMHISRRWVKKHGIPDPKDQVSGYESMDEVCVDMEEVVDVLWFSGTPSIQIPTLLAMALALTEYLPSFPPAPRPTFGLLQKMDHCFASLLVGRDVKTNEPLPGFQRGLSAGFSRTDMVRIKSLADETRMLVAVVMSGEADVDDFEEEEEDRPVAIKTRTNTTADATSTKAPQSSVVDNDDDGDLEIIEDIMPDDSTSALIKHENDSNNGEDNEGDDEEGEEFIDVEPPTNKRKISQRQQHATASGDTTDSVDQQLADDAKKRIKMEDSDSVEMPSSSSPVYNSKNGQAVAIEASGISTSTQDGSVNGVNSAMKSEATAAGTTSSSTSNDHQFHWTVDDSDSDSDTDTNTNGAGGYIAPQSQPPPFPSATAQIQAQGRARGDVEEFDEADEEEEEELHLNVAKVYEKTLTQLGETLGDSILDD